MAVLLLLVLEARGQPFGAGIGVPLFLVDFWATVVVAGLPEHLLAEVNKLPFSPNNYWATVYILAS